MQQRMSRNPETNLDHPYTCLTELPDQCAAPGRLMGGRGVLPLCQSHVTQVELGEGGA